MTTQDTLALVKDLMTSPRESAERATAMLAEHDDPRVRLIAQMWAQQREAEQVDEESQPSVPARSAVPAITPAITIDPLPSDRSVEIRRLQRRLRMLVDELGFVRYTTGQLAQALGACHCMGEDDACPDCRGQGAPGSTVPDRALFARLVMPAIRRMKQSGSVPAHSGSNPTHPPPSGDASLERSDT